MPLGWIGLSCFIVYCLILTQLETSDGQFIQPGLCESRCHCPKGEGVVHCDRQDRLLGVPTNVPIGVTKLYIQQSHFSTPNYLGRPNLTGLHNLEHLQIIYCNLQVIEPRAFVGMTKLKSLDLSHNAILKLEPFTFDGLQLTSLYLNEQHFPTIKDQSLYISENAFHHLAAVQINLKGNRLNSVMFETFGKVTRLDRLILSENRISQIGAEFEQYFDHPDKLLDLTGNPLECHCRLAWISRRLPSWLSTLPGLNITCVYSSSGDADDSQANGGPYIFELDKLNADQLCPTSRIKHISIDVMDEAQKAVISCTAETMAKHSISGLKTFPQTEFIRQNPPGVAWRYVEGGQLREVRRLENQDSKNGARLSNQTSSAVSTVQLNVGLDSWPRKYTCATWDDKKQTEEVVVTLKGPTVNQTTLKQSIKFRPTDQSKMTANKQKHLGHTHQLSAIGFEQPHYLFQKQFTLLEMAGSVIGTFLATLIFLLIGARCVRVCQQHHSLFRFAPGCSSMLASDSKGIYLAGKASKSDQTTNSDSNSTPGKPINNNGFAYPSSFIVDPSFLNSQQSTQPYHNHLALSGINAAALAGKFSPHLTNPYLTVPGSLSSTVASPTGAPNDDLHSMLTSTPLIHSAKLRGLMSNEASNLAPFIATNPNHFNQWPVTPGSPYSGSHEYDIPRVLDFPNGGSFAPFGTMHSSAFPHVSEASNFHERS